MSKKPDNVLIGIFVAGAVAFTIVAVIVLGSGAFLKERNLFVLHFKGSVKGLSIGSPVVLRGVKIGSVMDISINATSSSRTFTIPVVIEIGKDLVIMPYDNNLGYDLSDSKNQKDKNYNLPVEKRIEILISQGLRAKLEMQSMVTGQLLVGLDFHPEKPARLSGLKSEYPEIPTIQTDIEEIAEKIKQVPIDEMFNKLFSIISSVEKSFNAQSIEQLLQSLSLTLKSLNKISESLDTNLPEIATDIQATIKSAKLLMHNSNIQLMTVSSSLSQAIVDTQKLIGNANNQVETTGVAIKDVVMNANQLITDLNDEVKPVSISLIDTLTATKTTLSSVKETLNAAKVASNQAGDMFKGVERMTGNDSVLIDNLNNTLNDLSDAARALRLLAEYLERHPEALIQGKQ